MIEVGTLVRLDLHASVLDALGLSADQHTHRVVGHDDKYLIITPSRFKGRESRITPDRVVTIDTVEGTCEEMPAETLAFEQLGERLTGDDPSRLSAQDDPRGERDR